VTAAAQATIPGTWPRTAGPPSLSRLRYFVIATAFFGLIGWVAAATLPGWLASRHAYLPGSDEARVFEDTTGIRLVRVGVTGAGGLLEVQYQILNPSKAIDTLQSQPVTPVSSAGSYEGHSSGHNGQAVSLIHEESGSVLNRVFHYSSVVHGDLRPGGTYYQILVNPSEVVASGSLVTVVMGNVRLQHVSVA
jgi:hypothetical protein